jgi:hypothetical protein
MFSFSNSCEDVISWICEHVTHRLLFFSIFISKDSLNNFMQKFKPCQYFKTFLKNVRIVVQFIICHKFLKSWSQKKKRKIQIILHRPSKFVLKEEKAYGFTIWNICVMNKVVHKNSCLKTLHPSYDWNMHIMITYVVVTYIICMYG